MATLELNVEPTSAETGSQRAETALAKVKREALAGERQLSDYVNTLTGVGRQSKSAADSANNFASAIAKEENAFDALKASLDPVYAAKVRFEKQEQEITRAVRLGITTQEEANRVLAQAKGRYDATAAAAELLANAQARAGASTRNFTPAISNASFQVQDFAIQMAAGTSASVAFAQQAPQFLGALGFSGQLALFGSLAGTAVAVGAALLGVGHDAESAKDPVDALADAIGDVNSALGGIERYDFDTVLDGMHASAVDIRDEFVGILAVIDEVQAKSLESALQTLRDQTGLQDAIQGQIFQESIAGQLGAAAPEFEFFGLDSLNEALFVLNAIKDIEGETRREILQSVEATTERLRLRGLLNTEAKTLLATIADELGLDQEIVDEADRRNQRMEEFSNSIRGALGLTQDAVGETNSWAAAMGGVADEINAILSSLSGISNSALSTAAAQVEIDALRAGKSIKEASQAAADFKFETETDALVTGIESRFGRAGEVFGSLVRGAREYGREVDKTLDIEREAARERERLLRKGERSGASDLKKEQRELERLSGAYDKLITSIDPAIAAELALRDSTSALNVVLAQGEISTQTYNSAVAFLRETIGDELLANSPLARGIETLNDALANGIIDIDQYTGAVDRLRQKQDEAGQATGIWGSTHQSISSAIVGSVSDIDSLSSAFGNLASRIAEAYIQASLFGTGPLFAGGGSGGGSGLFSFLGNILPSANGNVFSGGNPVPFANGAAFQGGNVVPFANGGVVDRPTFFPLKDGRTGLMGEAGKEAIMPLQRGSDGALGVKAEGGQQQQPAFGFFMDENLFEAWVRKHRAKSVMIRTMEEAGFRRG
ncbi:phage tail tape measure protein [Ruegeria sp.]|uniref:phage tail tape measure protein n=1 Tax=Ruegeria sp. TaxID=1879320 RepID=UPI003B5C7201